MDAKRAASIMTIEAALVSISPGTELFFQGATPQVSSPLQRFTTEFGMGRSGSTAP